MQTTCPHCNTVFLLTADQLKMADGRVRCGLCQTVFNAQIEATTPVLTEIARPVGAHEADPVADAFDASPPRSLIPDALRHSLSGNTRSQRRTQRGWGTLLWILGTLLLCASLVAEYVWFNRQQLAQLAPLRPYLLQVCALAACELPALHQPERIELLSRNVYTHPNARDALMIVVTMSNPTDVALAYPDMQLDFSNIRGGIMAARRFRPEEYLHAQATMHTALAAGTEISFSLEIKDPGKDAVTYEFSFL
jgi:predicted Zn finger-like uncharacterized protein